ncbi:MAG: MunI family type II restriction endonuclease [Bacteroidaceae bacterium]|nr:MunI family type II restriction endonuclease [Bacteroidaceae bacterium]
MGSIDNRFRRKWQDYSGSQATVAEHSFIEVFTELFKDTEYEVVSQPTDFKKLYVDVELTEEELEAIYTPQEPITTHGIQPDGAIRNIRTGKTIYVEIKRQDGWVEGKPRSAGRGNAHERLCKYFTPGLLSKLRTSGNIAESDLPFWIVFQGDITRDPCRVREITYWFKDFKANYFFWRPPQNAEDLIDHFETHIAPLLE